MTDDKKLNADAFAALQANFQAQSRKAQAYYTAMHAMSKMLKSDDAASAWMGQPLAALDGKTPGELVSAGRADEVVAYIGTLKA
jgi:uncharacterized protein (DUF2384 family)